MSENLYAPPRADLGTRAPDVTGSGDFEISRCFSEAWERTWANFPLWLGAGVVFVIAFSLAGVTILGIPLLWPVLMWGGFRFFVRMHDGGAQIGDLFAGFSRYGQALGAMLGYWLLNILIGLPGNILTQVGAQSSNTALLALGYLVAVAIAFFVTSRLTFAAFLLVDRDMALGEALSEAWSRTSPVKWKVALLLLAMGATITIGVFALLVGVIPATVMAYLMWVSAYRQIWGAPPTAA